MIRRAFILAILAAFMSAFIQNQNDDVIYYASLNHAIYEGQYDGVITAGKLKDYGNFGLGSEEKLAGELIIVDNEFYTIPSDGKAKKMVETDKIAFAAVKNFSTDTTLEINDATDLKRLEATLNNVIDRNAFAAIRIKASFKTIVFRSFVEQEKPYKPIAKVEEVKFNRDDIAGTIVGFFTPKSSEVLNSPNYHFHFIDDQKQTGGHVLGFTISNAIIEIDYANELHIILPQPEQVEHVNLNKPLKPKQG